MGSFFKRVQSNKQLKMAGAEATDDVIIAEKTGPPRREQVVTELKLQVKLAAPVVLGYLLQMMLNMIVLFFVGHHDGAHELAAVSLANMYVGVTGLSVIYGVSTAMDTLCAQEVGRDPHSKRVGMFLQRGILVNLSFLPVIAVLWFVTEPLLVALQQDPDIARLAGYYTRILVGGLPSIMIFECQKKYLQAQSYMAPIFITMMVAAGINILASYVFVMAADMGIYGAPIALVMSWISLPIVCFILIRIKGYHKNTWGGWSKEAWKDWKQYFKFGIPGMIMLCNEWWAFEILALAAGILGELQLASQTIVLTTSTITFMVPFGIGVAGNVRVGNLLGAGLPQSAKLSAVVAFALGSLVMVVEAGVLIAVRHVWGYVFTNDEAVANMVADLLLICSAFQVLDGMQGVLAGVVRGLGKQKYGAAANFIAFYVVGLPSGIALAFPGGMDVYGLWWGLCISLFGCVVAYGIICKVVRWDASETGGSAGGAGAAAADDDVAPLNRSSQGDEEDEEDDARAFEVAARGRGSRAVAVHHGDEYVQMDVFDMGESDDEADDLALIRAAAPPGGAERV